MPALLIEADRAVKTADRPVRRLAAGVALIRGVTFTFASDKTYWFGRGPVAPRRTTPRHEPVRGGELGGSLDQWVTT